MSWSLRDSEAAFKRSPQRLEDSKLSKIIAGRKEAPSAKKRFYLRRSTRAIMEYSGCEWQLPIRDNFGARIEAGLDLDFDLDSVLDLDVVSFILERVDTIPVHSMVVEACDLKVSQIFSGSCRADLQQRRVHASHSHLSLSPSRGRGPSLSVPTIGAIVYRATLRGPGES